MKGWQCPVCGRVWAPHVSECLSPHSIPATGANPPAPGKPEEKCIHPVVSKTGNKATCASCGASWIEDEA